MTVFSKTLVAGGLMFAAFLLPSAAVAGCICTVNIGVPGFCAENSDVCFFQYHGSCFGQCTPKKALLKKNQNMTPRRDK
jgi:hypothetical protein